MVALASATILAHFQKTSTYSPEYIAYAEAQIAAKQEFAKAHMNLNRDLAIDEDVRAEMHSTIMADETLSSEERESQLNAIGFYTFQEAKPATSSNAILFSNVSIQYDNFSGNWTIQNSILWKDAQSRDALSSTTWPTAGQIYNIGSENYAGILLTDTYGDSSGLSVVSTLLSLKGYDNVINENPNRFPGVTASHGVMFKYQDNLKVLTVDFWGSYTYQFNDNQISTWVTYNSNFANVHGNAVGAYGHTWDNTQLNSIGFGLDGSVSFGWATSGNRWDVISPTDEHF